MWWRVGVHGGGDGVSLRLVLGVVPLGVWFAITEHSPLRVARARWSGSPSGRSRRVLTRPSGRRLFRSRQGPPLSLGGAAVLGGGVGVAGCDGVVGTGGGGGPGGFLVVLFRGGARGVGAHADVDPRVCAHGLRLGVGRGLAAAAVAGHALYVGCHRGLVGGGDAAGGPWRRSGLVGGGPWAWGAGSERWRDEVHRASVAARSAMKVVAAASVTVGGRRAGCCFLRAWDGWGRMS